MPARRIRIPFQLEFWIDAAALWLLSALILSYLVMERPPFPLARMEQLRVGMTKAEVRALLGDPVNCQGNVWKWSIGWPIVSVEFDERGRFRSWECDR